MKQKELDKLDKIVFKIFDIFVKCLYLLCIGCMFYFGYLMINSEGCLAEKILVISCLIVGIPVAIVGYLHILKTDFSKL